MPQKHKLFSVFGIEAEYMIVDKQTLKVKPIADKILSELNSGVVCNEVELGRVSWSNELVNHVLEIKCTEPEKDLNGLDQEFHQSVNFIQSLLAKENCCLMPTAMNPWFDPATETKLWPHGQNEIYSLYNTIFDCRGHGWSNLQSVHINLPYANEEEFVRLHSAIRKIIPLIPGLAASSPFYEGKRGPFADNRLSFYEKNQIKVPTIIGNIIPEDVRSFADYDKILKDIYADIGRFENAEVLQHPWLNSRAAIPKFEYGAIEIRLMDIQESPYMDFCLVNLVVQMVKWAIDKSGDQGLTDKYLREVYNQTKEFDPKFNLGPFENFFAVKARDFNELRQQIIKKFLPLISSRYHVGLEIIAKKGNLAQRLVKNNLSIDLYQKVIKCLEVNSPYEG